MECQDKPSKYCSCHQGIPQTQVQDNFVAHQQLKEGWFHQVHVEDFSQIEIVKNFDKYFSGNSNILGSECKAINHFAIIFACWSSWIILALTKTKFQIYSFPSSAKIEVSL
jgi:hypothetical protein